MVPQKLPALMMRPTDQADRFPCALVTFLASPLPSRLEPMPPSDNIGVPTPLRIAAYNGHLEVIRAPVSHGGEVSLARSGGRIC